MYYILLFVIGYGVGIATTYQEEKVNQEFYKANCVAGVGEVSVMTNKEGKPNCVISTMLKKHHGSNLKDWKE